MIVLSLSHNLKLTFLKNIFIDNFLQKRTTTFKSYHARILLLGYRNNNNINT